MAGPFGKLKNWVNGADPEPASRPAERPRPAPATGVTKTPTLIQPSNDLAPPPREEEDYSDQGILLTASHQPLGREHYVQTEHLASHMALFESGLLLVAEDFAHSPQVDAFRVFARQSGHVVNKFKSVPLKVIQHLNRQASVAVLRHKRQPEPAEENILRLIMAAHDRGATDIHMSADEEERQTTIHNRINKRRGRPARLDFAYGMQLAAVLYNMGTDKSHSSYDAGMPQSAMLSPKFWDLPEDLDGIRLQFNPNGDSGRSVYMRLLWDSPAVRTLGGMGYHPSQIAVLEQIALMPDGLFLPTGKTGSAKSTLIALLLNTRQKYFNFTQNIVTAEDPREFKILGNQMPVRAGAGSEERKANYIATCASIWRSDPDAAMITEFRDPDSAQAGMELADSGVPLFSSAHSASFIETAHRLHGMGIPDWRWANPGVLRALCNQRLVPTLCPQCREYIPSMGDLNDGELMRYGLTKTQEKRFRATWAGGVWVANPEGCNRPGCYEGYCGSTILAEVGHTDFEMMDALRSHDYQRIFGIWDDRGYLTRQGHAALKVRDGTISPIDAETMVGIVTVAMLEAAERVDAKWGGGHA